MCRPYLSNFEINGHYLIAPNALDNTSNTEYDFFSCSTDYLQVNMLTNMAYGKYSMIRYIIDIKTFESTIDHGDWDLVIAGLLIGILILTLIVRRNKKRMLEKNRVKKQ